MKLIESPDTKTHAVGGLEYDVTVARRYYCYLANNPMWNKFAKRSMNRRLRRHSKEYIRQQMIYGNV